MAKKSADKTRRLYRSRTNVVIAGVAAGLAEYFDLDPILVRILFVIAALFNGFGVLAYLVLWILVPREDGEIMSEATIRKNVDEMKARAQHFATRLKSEKNKNDGKYFFGILLIIIGIAFFLNQLGLFRLDLFWPVVLILLGAYIIIGRS